MKKIFNLVDPKHAPARKLDIVKGEIRKYIERERRKALPDGHDFWDFDCKLSADESTAEKIHLSEINKKIDGVIVTGKNSFYVEILARPAKRIKR